MALINKKAPPTIVAATLETEKKNLCPGIFKNVSRVLNIAKTSTHFKLRQEMLFGIVYGG